MGAVSVKGHLFDLGVIGVGLLLGMGCATEAPMNNTNPIGGQPFAGAQGQPIAGAQDQPVAGTTGVPAAGTTGLPMAGTTGEAGTAANPMGGAGMDGTAGTAAGTGPEAGTGGNTNPPSTDFMHCVSGIENWGTAQQAGPCGSSTTRYGVDIEYGPYGARQEYNVGQGFENALATGDNDGGATCRLFVATFAADPEASAELQMTMDLNFALYTVFYPGVMPEGEKFPLIVWGNGTCAMPEGYGALLRYVASYGYIIVAPNSRWVGSGAAMRRGLDFMFAANMDQSSKYYQKIDTDNVGAMGHSQGGMGTAAASSDPRIKSVILWNGGTSASKPFLAVSGERDIFTTQASQLANPVNAAQRPAAYIFYHDVPMRIDGKATGGSAGHLTLMNEPERVVEPAVAWWDMMLKGSATAKQMFIPNDCTLCSGTAYPSRWVMPPSARTLSYGKNSMLQ
jgi:hypothetical protein